MNFQQCISISVTILSFSSVIRLNMKDTYFLGVTIAATICLLGMISVANSAECSNWERPQLTANYTPQGQVVFEAGMDTYVTGNMSSSKVLIAGTVNRKFN